MTHIIQICPDIGPGTGVGGVAYHLERQWLDQGLRVDRFTMSDARGAWLPQPSATVPGKVALMARVVWFSTVGTALARRRLRGCDAVSVCHNDALAGDIYVNHGIVQVAMRARGAYWMRMVRNPLHLFTAVRDRWRYSGHAGHRVVVNLVDSEEEALRRTFPGLRVDTVVIGNGVDIERYTPATDARRAAARAGLGIGPEEPVLLFVGHEFERKGLGHVLRALPLLPDAVRLVVVGGTEEMIDRARAQLPTKELRSRVHFVGSQKDPLPWFHASDVFVLPSAYESYPLVVLEALACGVPVVATPTGCVPDVVTDGENGFVVAPSGREIASAVEQLLRSPKDELRRAARAAAEQHSWDRVAEAYLEQIDRIARERRVAAT